MATSNVGNAIAQVVSAIQAVDGTGTYTYDLSGDNTVHLGYMATPPADKFVMISDITGAEGVEGNTLDAYTHTWSMTVIGYVEASTDTYLARVQAAADLYHDVIRGLSVDRTLGGYARRVWPTDVEIGGSQGAAPSFGFFRLELNIEIKNGRGA